MSNYNAKDGLDLGYLSGLEQFSLFKTIVLERLEFEYSRLGINLYKDCVDFDKWKWNTDRNNLPLVRHSDLNEDVVNDGSIKTEGQLKKWVYKCDISVF